MKILFSACLFVFACTGFAAQSAKVSVPPLEWSVRMARSEMARSGEKLFHQGAPKARWDYTTGLFSLALWRLSRETGDAEMAAYAGRLVDSFIDEEGDIRTYRLSDYNIDMITPGRVVLHLYEETPTPRLRHALDLLRRQLAEHPRTSERGFWHKQRYPHQMWLDGLYMGAPFYAYFTKLFGPEENYDDIARQFMLIDRHLYDESKGLYYHGWDEARVQNWAHPQTGTSANFWGRGMGWFAMALVDTLEYFPAIHHDQETLVAILNRVAEGIERYQDAETGLWWQVLDQGGRAGNYREASASSMFVYSLARAINRGYLPANRYAAVARRGYEGILRDFIRDDGHERISLTQICQVAGLSADRDGSYEYYLREPIVDNDLKGVGPFILAGLEIAQLPAAPSGDAVFGRRQGWEAVPGILARIQPPQFPDRVFPITAFGAMPDADATEAIRLAIAACHASGGGRVVIPPGTWRTGAIHLLSQVNLHVEENATLLFSTDPAAYLPVVFTRWEGVECLNYSPLIYALDQANVAVTGRGTLDGQAANENWWSWKGRTEYGWQKGAPSQHQARERLIAFANEKASVPVEDRRFGEGSYLRPNFIQFYRCRNVLIEGVTIRRSPMWNLHPVLSSNVTVRGVQVISHGPNNDGCNPESCTDVLIEDCLFDTGDDCLAIKSGRNDDGRRLAVPSANLVIRHCTMKDGHGGVVMGSEISGGCRNVFVEHCRMDSPNLDRALRFKSNAVRGGIIENVHLRDITIGAVAEAVITADLLYEEGANGSHFPLIRHVTLERVRSSASPRVLFLAGFPGAVIDDVQLVDCQFAGVSATDVISHAGKIVWLNTSVQPAKKSRSLHSPSATGRQP